MAQINKNPAYMALPSGIKRGVAAALDTTSVWYDYDKMVAYAKGGQEATNAGVAVTAYVGQILSLINETAKTATAYVIMDTDGTLQEVGSATLGDNKTISLTDGILGLKNWGVEYYAWIEAVGEEGTEGYVAGHHVKQVVDETHPWLAGLEPKATTATDGTIEIAWYQPSTTTIEGVSSAIASVQNTVETLAQGIGSAEDAAGTETVYGEINGLKETVEGLLPLTGGTMTGDITLKDGSIAASEKVVDAKVAAAIGSAGHLKREIVETLPEASAADPDTIYMIKKTGTEEYLEYILVTVGETKTLEKIGDTAVNLDPYMQKVSGATNGNIASLNAAGEVVDGLLAVSAVSDHLSNTTVHITAEERTAWEGKVDSTNETYTKLAQNADKLANLPAITEIGSGLTLAEGVLTTTGIPIASDTVLGGIKVDNSTVTATAEGVLSVKVNASNGLSIGENGITLAAATPTAPGAMTAEQATRLANIANGAQVNIVEGALLGPAGEEVTIDENKKLILPIGSEASLGLVKATSADNGVAIAADGTMSVNRVASSKLYVAEGDELVLNGGAA